MYTMGFIGTGNMGGALAEAASKKLDGAQIALSNRTASKAAVLAARLGCFASNNTDVAVESKYIMLGVKPQMMAGLLSELRLVFQSRNDRFILVSMAAGLSIDKIREMAGGEYPVIRIMPNTPCSIGSGVILCCKSDNVTDGEYAAFKGLLSEAGVLTDISENLIDAGSALSGCGPAFVYTFIEAMADAGVACGLTRKDALSLASSTVMGSADMVIRSGQHPAQLRDNVCSPGGSTIEGVLSLENDGFRAAVANCVIASYEKTKELGK